MSARKQKKITSEELRNKLKLKHFEARRKISEKHPHVGEIFKQKGFELSRIREHSAKILSTGVLAGTLLLSPPSNLYLPTPSEIIEKLKLPEIGEKKNDQGKSLAEILTSILPKRPRPLLRSEEKLLESVFRDVLGISARGTLEGEHLNSTYGFIGIEQHLRRFPGDVLQAHGDAETIKEGMAPGLGAFGYFARSKQEFTKDLEEKERWYAVVQTLYLPDWNRRQPYLKDWYKYRKVLIVNTENGKAVVAAIADSGPAAWTGKQFGGSPEVMHYLGGAKYKKGAVIVFFVDDPENKVPLGPVEYN
ncbi:hypothetical protein A2865_03450 [Candidatus Woesebacteria bacterium RIFCSPHIGHO2_01_FULL_39_17]|uniref:Uncharacterized protein n=3 Tax=Candidatus Woeseibacteriota TaxID=1752722 RepID=A0A0G0QVH1_9BACT|nr:MAG: hypothetical protein US72_C0007G0007 [Microgenomates group bacterium GW2011_GWC1_38_12]KKQ93792.1 MAG: hypothetical protein UT19_C0007G0036 [Candidatus Woesebacteria bacterium GW2011_GWB1_39_10b]KKR14355.1 MAG: hypothetical protein UT40_C0002G0034 [Candidatus Woesebacteria bacterium GW2011_GWA1_39_21b]OGM23588.1 MAG: hypothetical protein A2865_03450 [Candidatus Woesebacteria bacterium RIFCSPHIGHO2_01_FULL_39_17]OGM64324.1 MAG: hypothetical protein A3A52_05305 [Candidatus Woesebacteria b